MLTSGEILVKTKAACGHRRTLVKTKLNSFFSLRSFKPASHAFPVGALLLLRLLWGGECVLLFLLEQQMRGSGRRRADSLGPAYSGAPSTESKGVVLRAKQLPRLVYVEQESQPSQQELGPLWLGQFVLSFLLRVRWRSVSCGRKYSALPRAALLSLAPQCHPNFVLSVFTILS